MKDLLNILNQFIEDVEDNDPDKNMIKNIINLLIINFYHMNIIFYFSSNFSFN